VRCEARHGALSLTRWTQNLRAAMNAEPGHARLFASLRRAACTDDEGLLLVSAGLDPTRGLDQQGDSFWWGHPAFGEATAVVQENIARLLANKGDKTVDDFHRELGRLMWDKCGMSRSQSGLEEALEAIPKLRESFWNEVSVTGTAGEFNQVLERAGRVADFMELGELMCRDALQRTESCGGHFREEYQTEESEAKRDDTHQQHVTAWEYKGTDAPPASHFETLEFKEAKPTQRSYK